MRKLAALLVLMPGAALADGLSLQFQEDAPRDRFIIENRALCALSPMTLTIDLRGSAAGLIFDTVPGGAGENVAQPLRVASSDTEIEISPRSDGARDAELTIGALPVGGRIILTLDVDDTVPIGPMGVQMIAGSEIVGATFRSSDGTEAIIDDKGRALLGVPCAASS